MATSDDEQAQLTSSSGSSNSYGGINNSIIGDKKKSTNPLKRQWKELASGKQRLSTVLLFSVIAAMGSCLMGFALGYSSLAQLDMKYKNPLGTEPDDQQFQYFGGILNIGALIAGLITGVISDKIGRKLTLILGSVPCALGWFLIAASWYFYPDGNLHRMLPMLLAGRFLTGFASGCFSLVVPVYIVEISPTNLKGLFGSINQLAVTVGILLIYVMTTLTRYYIVALVAIGCTLIFVIAVMFLPETPRWLIANRQRLRANAILYRLRGPKANIVREMNTLEKAIEKEEEFSFVDQVKMLSQRSSLIPLIFSIILMFFQQFCGINVIIFYAGNVLETAHMGVKTANISADFGVGVIQVIFTLISVLLVDLLGRRVLLTLGGALLSLSTAALGIFFFLEQKYPNNATIASDSFQFIAVACLAVFIIGFSLGWGPIPWLMMGELAPLQIRGIVSGIATALNWSFSAIITVSFNKYSSVVHPYGAWWTFSVISALSIVFVLVFLPETRGKDLEDIQEYFEKKYGGRAIVINKEDKGNVQDDA